MVFKAFEVGAAYSLGSVEGRLIVPLVVSKLFSAALPIVLCVFTGDFCFRKALKLRRDKPLMPASQQQMINDQVTTSKLPENRVPPIWNLRAMKLMKTVYSL
jgi:hypothetical protein